MSKWEYYRVDQVKEKYLYRFLSEENLKRFLNTGCIWLSRADLFGDKMECVSIQDLMSNRPPIADIEKRKRRHLISCWHLATNESLAMWDTYVSDITKRRVLAVRFEAKTLIKMVGNSISSNKLPKSISKLIAGSVRYKNLLRNSKELSDDDKVRYVAFRKEYVFNYENEFRFVIQGQREFDIKGLNYFLGEELLNLSFSILVNPLLEKDEYVRIKSEVLKGKFKDKFDESALTKWLKPEMW